MHSASKLATFVMFAFVAAVVYSAIPIIQKFAAIFPPEVLK